MPGIGDYPPDTTLGVNDPNLIGRDDVAMREARTRDEPTVESSDRDLDHAAPDGLS